MFDYTTHKAIFINVHYNYKQLDKKLKGLLVWRQLLFVTPSKNYWSDWLVFSRVFLS